MPSAFFVLRKNILRKIKKSVDFAQDRVYTLIVSRRDADRGGRSDEGNYEACMADH